VRCPAAIPAIALAAGIAAGIFVPLHPDPWLLVASWLAAACATFLHRDRLAILLLAAGFSIGGALLGAQAQTAALETSLGEFFDQHVATPRQFQLLAVVEGRLRADAAPGPSGVSLSVDVDRIEVDGVSRSISGGIIVGVAGQLAGSQIPQWRAGRRVRFPATLRRPANYLNPGVPDSGRQLGWRGTTLVGSVKSDRLVEIVAHGTPLSEALASVRRHVRMAVAISVAPWSTRSAAIVSAILIGDRAGLDEEVQRTLQEAGTYHVIAISGGNIAILAGLFVLVLHLTRIGPRASAVLIITMLSIYALVVEGGSSVGRATLMATIYFGAQIWDHRTLPANVAAVSAAALFCVDPLQFVDAGFVLTFGATLGILLGMPKLSAVANSPRWLYPVFGLFAASLCAEIALLPISALVFSRVTAAGLIANFVAIPMMTIVQIAGIAAVALAHLGFDSALWAGWVVHAAVQGLVGSAGLVEWFPWLSQRVPPPSMFVVFTYYASLIAALLSYGRATLSLTLLALCALWIVSAPVVAFGRSTSQPLRVTFLDVGQGDASIVQFPDGRSLSIDAGGLAGTTFDVGGRVVSPALWALGVRRVDYMSISHGDPDHMGGALSVFRDFHPFEVWEGVPVPPHQPTNRLRAFADAAGTAWRTLQPADRMSFGDVLLHVHHPPAPDWERQRVRNDDSVVVELRYGGVSVVFTGDIGTEVERAIAPAFARAPIRILKVPHHGSATSSSPEFLRGLRPDIAVISAGRGNPYGHPVPAVVSRYRDLGAAIYRTDLDGAVMIETDGQTVRVRTFNGRRLTLRTHGFH
jgi:competence protein ComEC